MAPSWADRCPEIVLGSTAVLLRWTHSTLRGKDTSGTYHALFTGGSKLEYDVTAV